MRVTYVLTVSAGGPISHLCDLAPQVAAEGVEVSVVCPDTAVAANFEAVGLNTTVAPVTSKWDMRGGLSLLAAIGKPDVVHTQDRRAGFLARPLGRLCGAQVVHTYHGLPEDIACMAGRAHVAFPPEVSRGRQAWLVHGYFAIERWLTKLGKVIVPSHAVARFLTDMGLSPQHIEVIPSGITVLRRDPGPAHVPAVLGTTAILGPLKALDVLLRACAMITFPVHLEILGDGPLRVDLEALAAELGLNVAFRGAVADVRDRLSTFDIFVLPSRGENLPIAILEAMACALPIVATRVGGIPELVVHGENGFLVEPDDEVALARAISDLLRDADQCTAFGRQSAARVAMSFDSGDMARRTVDLYHRLTCGSTVR